MRSDQQYGTHTQGRGENTIPFWIERPFWWKLVVTDVSELSSREQSFNVQITFQLIWKMDREEALDYGIDPNLWQPKEKPVMSALNFKRKDPDSCSRVEVVRDNQGRKFCTYFIDMSMCFNEAMELENFPFDTQHFTMVFNDKPFGLRKSNWAGSPYTSELAKRFEGAHESLSFDTLVFFYKEHVSDHEFKFVNLAVDIKDFGSGVQKTYISFIAQRAWEYYFWRVYAVLGGISFLTMLGVKMDFGNKPDQMMYASMMLISALVYQNVLADILPRLHYTTVLDRYILWTLMIIFAVLIECMFLGQISDEDIYEERSEVVLYANILFWAVLHMYISLRCLYIYRIEKNKQFLGPVDLQKYFAEFQETMYHKNEARWIVSAFKDGDYNKTKFVEEKLKFDDCLYRDVSERTIFKEYIDTELSEQDFSTDAKVSPPVDSLDGMILDGSMDDGRDDEHFLGDGDIKDTSSIASYE